jgi:hypothetical protein
LSNFTVIVISSFFLLSIVQSAKGGEPYYALNASYARSQDQDQQGEYHRIAYIPAGFLLYEVGSRDNPKKIHGLDYLQATTQDGVKVFVLKSEVSINTFRKNFPEHEVIFNSPTSLCRIEGCNPDVEGNTGDVRPGEFLKIVTDKDVSDSFYKLAASRGEDIFFYVNKADLQRRVISGYVTRADMYHPQYHFQKKEEKTLGTRCGEVRQSVPYSVKIEKDPVPNTLIVENFGLGTVDKNIITYTRSYGGDGKKISFFVYDITNNRTIKQFQMIAMIEYACENEGFFEKLTRINLVQLINLESNKRHTLSYEDYKTEEDLFKYTKAPYLFSVNSYPQYIRLLARLGEELENRSLAGYFLSQFNISCDLKYRKTICGKHDY